MNNIINNISSTGFGARIRFKNNALKQDPAENQYVRACAGAGAGAVKYAKKAFTFTISISALISKVKQIKNSVRIPS